MGCLESLNYEVILRDATFSEVREYVRSHFAERYQVNPGYRLFEKHLIGVPPLLVGLDGDDVILPYTKPCYGTFLVRVPGCDEAARVRVEGKREK
jgi:hypothetical protein